MGGAAVSGAGRTARLGYADTLRCLAALGVVVLHCAGAAIGAEAVGTTRWLCLNLMDGGVRWSVPLFIMLSGAFMLDPDRPMPRGRWLGQVARLGTVTAVWVCLYALWDTRDAHRGMEHLLEALIKVVRGEYHYHLWFLPMLLCLYLLTPLLRALVKGAERRTLWYAVALWGVVAVGFATYFAFFPGGPVQTWYSAFNPYNLVGYWGFFLLGWLLRTARPHPRAEAALYLLGGLGLAVTVGGTWALSARSGSLDLRLYSNFAPNVVLTAAALFVLFRRLEVGRGGGFAPLAACTLGVYLLHPYWLEMLDERGFPDAAWNVAWAIPLQAAVLTALSVGCAWVLRRIPRVGRWLC